MLSKRKIIVITTCLIIAAVAIVLFVRFFTGDKPDEFDGTLVFGNLMNLYL